MHGFNKFLTMRKMAPAGDGGEGSTNVDDFGGGDPNETFDDMEYESEGSKAAGKAYEEKFKDRIERAKKAKGEVEGDEEKPSKEKKASKEEKKSSTEKVKDLDIVKDEDDLEDKDEKPKDKKEAKVEKEDPADKDSKKEDEKGADKNEPKKLKIRMGDGLYGIDSDSKVRVKIDGDFQEVPIQELINNYSGKTAWDKKFTEIGNEKKALEFEKGEVTKTKDFLTKTVSEIIGHLDDQEKNPLDALYFLVEKSGRDIYSVYKRMIDANLEEVEKLLSLSDIERKAYFLEKKDEFRTKSDQARMAEAKKEQTFNQGFQKLASLRQAHGISEEQYLQALDELESEGKDTDKMSDEQVVDYASLKPHVNTVQDVLQPYEDSIDDSKYSKVVQNLARQLRANEITKEQLTEWARTEFMDEDVKDLHSRTNEVQKKTSRVEVKQPDKFDTLDFDDEA